jgi:hypothetical protein
MWFTGEHLTHIETFETTFDALHFLESAHLKSLRGKGSAYFLG